MLQILSQWHAKGRESSKTILDYETITDMFFVNFLGAFNSIILRNKRQNEKTAFAKKKIIDTNKQISCQIQKKFKSNLQVLFLSTYFI